MEFTPEQLALIAANECTVEEVSRVLEMFPQSLETCIGYVVGLKKGMGQERNEPFTPTPEENT